MLINFRVLRSTSCLQWFMLIPYIQRFNKNKLNHVFLEDRYILLSINGLRSSLWDNAKTASSWGLLNLYCDSIWISKKWILVSHVWLVEQGSLVLDKYFWVYNENYDKLILHQLSGSDGLTPSLLVINIKELWHIWLEVCAFISKQYKKIQIEWTSN